MFLALAFFAIAGTRTTFAQQLPNPSIQGLGQLNLNIQRTNSCSVNLVSSTGVCLIANVTSTPKEVEKPKPKVEVQTNRALVALANSQTQPQTNRINSNYVISTVTLDSEKIFGMVNDYRIKVGLTPFEEENSVCSLAQVRATEISDEISNGSLHSGLYNRPLPYWIWENAKYGSNEEGTVAWWLASRVHRQSIVGDYKFSCVKCAGTYCSQLFTSFAPK